MITTKRFFSIIQRLIKDITIERLRTDSKLLVGSNRLNKTLQPVTTDGGTFTAEATR